jgi:hypothetical protein
MSSRRSQGRELLQSYAAGPEGLVHEHGEDDARHAGPQRRRRRARASVVNDLWRYQVVGLN